MSDENVNVSQRVTPEMLTYQLGDFLVESGAITGKQLERALEYQERYAGERHVLLGQALLEMGLIDRDTLDKAITTQLLALQEALKETNRQLESCIQQRTQDLESRVLQIRTAAGSPNLLFQLPAQVNSCGILWS